MSRPKTPEELLDSPEICVLSTVSSDGSAHAMPMWYLYEDGRIWFLCATTAQKTRNVARTGTATVTLDLREKPYYAIMVKGDAEVVDPMDEASQLRLMTRYISEADAKDYIASLKERGNLSSIVVTPTKTVEFSN